MKKRILALAIALCLALCMLTSCEYIMGGGVADSGDVTVVIENSDGTYDVYKAYLEEVDNKSEGAWGILEHLSARENHPLALTVENGEWGKFIKGIGSIAEDSANGVYVMVYTSVMTDGYEGAPTIDYEGTPLTQSGFGVSEMTVSKGCVILFRLEEMSW